MDPRSRGDQSTVNLAAPAGQTTSASLLVYEQDSSWACPLPSGGDVLIGRSADCAVKLRDAAASRQHARIVLGDGETRLVDLGSHNGTNVNGEAVSGSRLLRPGDVIAIGSATIVFQAGARPPAERAVVALGRFRERCEEELERSVRYQRSLAVLAIEIEDAAGRARVAELVAHRLRIMDVLTWDGPTRLLALLPELGREDGARAASAHLAALAGAGARLGLATCPEEGCDVDTLLAGARAAAAAAAPDQSLGVDDAVKVHEIGGRTITVADPATIRLFELIQRLAASDLAVLVHGETGSGKESAATALHVFSKRAARPLRTLNCAAMPETLIESELFGHEKGAFTGAVASKPGLLETADGGTLFLDEIGELTAAAQAKLLRALETKRVTRLGDVKERQIDLRVVSATNRNLAEEVKAGRFREDLFFRLSGATLVVPPLRARPRELAILARRFLDEATAAAGRGPVRISPRAMRALAAHSWPGNIRELRHAADYVAATVDGDVVEVWHLPDGIRPADEEDAGPEPAPRSPGEGGGAAPAAPRFRPVADEIRELERQRMLEALDAAGWVQARAAALITMPLRTFMAKMKLYGLRAARARPER